MRGRSDPYYRNNAVAAAHLQMAGHPASTQRWGGGTEGIEMPHPDSPNHVVAIGQHPDERDGSWQFRVHRHPDDPHYEQEGLTLGRSQMNRLTSQPGTRESHMERDEDNLAYVTAHPRDIPGHLTDFLKHPQVKAAVRNDVEKMKTERKMPGPLSGDQFRPRSGD